MKNTKNIHARTISVLPLSLAALSLLLLISVLISGCTSLPLPEDLYICSVDSDCIPKPECHPMECINQRYESKFSRPHVCTEMFSFNAAYSKEDCACENNLCVNKNLHNSPFSQERACESDSDCACGRHITTGECFYGNKQYVDTTSQCPDFCTGIAGNFEIRCVENLCTQLSLI